MSASALQRRQNGVAIVANETREIDDGAVTFGERGQHRSIRVGDLIVARLGARRQQLVAGDDQSHARPADEACRGEADRAHDADVLRPQHTAGLEQRRAANDVLAALADVLLR